MKRARTVAVISSLALVGALLGAIAGAVTVGVGLFAIELRNGHLVWPVTAFGTFFGVVIGSPLGFALAAMLPFSPWRYVPVGRLFGHLTIGAIIGGCACALVLRDPSLAILGGIIGFVVAGRRLGQASATPTGASQSEPSAPSG